MWLPFHCVHVLLQSYINVGIEKQKNKKKVSKNKTKQTKQTKTKKPRSPGYCILSQFTINISIGISFPIKCTMWLTIWVIILINVLQLRPETEMLAHGDAQNTPPCSKWQLTLKCPSEKSSHWCPRGVGTYSPLKTIFTVEFMHKICTIDRGHQSLLICEEKKLKCFTVSKWQSFENFRFASLYPKIWRTTFPKEFFDEI